MCLIITMKSCDAVIRKYAINEYIHLSRFSKMFQSPFRITSTPYAVLPLFAPSFAACTGGIWVTFIEPYLI